MTRESRLIVVLLVMSAIGISGLMFVSEQYRKALLGHGAPEASLARAARLVDGFLAARAAGKAVVSRYPGNPADVATSYRIERLNALSTRQLSYADYAVARATWRAVMAGQPASDGALASAFRARQGELAAADLGVSEALDDAVK